MRSLKNSKLYIGYTNDLKKRLGQHNKGLSISTKLDAPWEVVYYEAFKGQELAKAREYNLKYFGKAYGQLKRRIGL